MTTTDTPRTDAVVSEPCAIHQVMQKWEKIIENSRQLERELAAEIANRQKCCKDGNKISDELFDAQQKLKKAEAELERIYAGMQGSCYCCEPVGEMNQKLEAEVERLKEQYEFAAESVARMHEAAVGEIRGPIISVIEDIKAVRERAEKAEAEAERLRSTMRSFILVSPIEFERMEKAESEVERLKDLLNRAINEIEKAPFHTPKLTAFTAHRLAEKYREKMTNKSTKPVESQEDDK